MAAQEAEEAVALDGAELGAGEGFGGDFIDAVGEHCIEAEHGARSGNAHDHLAVFKAPGSEFEIAAADQIEQTRVFALIEEGCLGGQGDGAGGELKIGENGAAQRAEPAGAAIGAGRTTRGRLPCHVSGPPWCDCCVLCVSDHAAPFRSRSRT